MEKNEINELNKEKNIIRDKTENNIINTQKENIEEINVSENKNKIIIQENPKKKNLSEVKKYLDYIEQDKYYVELINNNPEKLFDFLEEKLFMEWQSVLFNFDLTIINSDEEIENTKLNRDDQKLIEGDTKRTRVRESKLIPGFFKILEKLLTFYCNIKKIKYKQGLNEIFGPLILIQYKIKRLKLVNLFNFGEAFIDRFLPNYFYEQEIFSLRSSQSLYILLLKYHEPSVFNYLDSLDIPHELYATNWLVTLRSGKVNLDILYYLWDKIIKFNDPLFIHFLLVAFIIYNRELLINCDSNLLMKLVTNLTITSKDELDDVVKIALKLRDNTPYSFRLLSNKIGFLKINNKDIVKTFEKYKPEKIFALPIFPTEISYVNNKKSIICPDPECINNNKDKNIKIDWANNNICEINKDKNHICEKCNMNIIKDLNYVILDLRIFPPNYFKKDDDYFKLGFVSGMMAIDKEELQSDDVDNLLSSHLMQIRGKNHIILMTSKTDYFYEFEEKFYSNNISDKDKRKMLFGIIETQKTEKTLNLSDVKNLNLEEIYKLKEYDNLRKVMNSLKNKNFPYVSYLEGGFEALHEECINYKIELFGHDKKMCKLCQNITGIKENKKNKRKKGGENILNLLWKNPKIITEKDLDIFFINEENVFLPCSLRKYKDKSYHNKDYELFVVILFDKNCVEIYKKNYKNELKKEENNTISDYYNLGIKKEKNDFKLKLIEKMKFEDIIKVSFNHEYKNIIIIEVKDQEKGKKEENNFTIELEFLSIDDSKTFMKSIIKIDKEKK